MVSLLKSEESSEPDMDLNLHISDNDTDEFKDTPDGHDDDDDDDMEVRGEKNAQEGDHDLDMDIEKDKSPLHDPDGNMGTEQVDDDDDDAKIAEDTEDTTAKGKLKEVETNAQDLEDFIEAGVILKASFENGLEANSDLSNQEASNVKDTVETEGAQEELVLNGEEGGVECQVATDMSKPENKDVGDLLLIMEEKAADVDDTEYEMAIAELAKEDSEEAILKDDTLHSTDNSKSPPGSNGLLEDSEIKTDRNSPDDLMDIGDNVLEIGDTNAESTEIIDAATEELLLCESESEREDNIEESKAERTECVNEVVVNGEASVDDTKDEIDQKTVEVEEDVMEATESLDEETDDIRKTGEIIKIVVEKPRGRGRPKKLLESGNVPSIGVEQPVAVDSSKPILSDLDGNKENVQEKESVETKSEVKNVSKEKKADGPFGVTTRSLRKRVSADSPDANEKTKKQKTDSLHKQDSPKLSDVTDESDASNDSKQMPGLKPMITLTGKAQGSTEQKHFLDLSISQLLATPVSVPMHGTNEAAQLKAERRVKFRTLIADKKLAGMTRETLETFAVQMVCETLVYKSEMAKLLRCIKDREATIDALQKEVASLNKQSKDLHIVHEKIYQDLQRVKKLSDKPLLVPRITRSVGLQACIPKEYAARKVSSAGFTAKSTTPTPPTQQQQPNAIRPTPPVANHTPLPTTQVLKQPSTPAKPKIVMASPQSTTKTPKTTPAKAPVKSSSAKAEKKAVAAGVVSSTTSPAKQGGGAGVIDLTSDDDKRTPYQRIAPGSKIVQTANGHQLVMSNGQSVMVKLPNQTNFILNTTSMPPSVLRTSTVNTTTTPRATTQTTTAIVAPHLVEAVATTPQQFEPPATAATVSRGPKPNKLANKHKHPAPFPVSPQKNISSSRPIPPRPILTLSKTACGNGIVLSWKINTNLELFAEIASYQIYAYQETKAEPRSENWSKVGDVRALQLPMAVTLTQFAANNRYYFAVRAVDVLTRVGPFSDYRTI